MNKICCICKKGFKIPSGAEAGIGVQGVSGSGLGSIGTLSVNGIWIKYSWHITSTTGFLCPLCALEQLLKIVRSRLADADGLLAGRNYDKTLKEPDASKEESREEKADQ